MIDTLSLIPKNSIHYIKSLIEIEDLKIKLVNKRKTKHNVPASKEKERRLTDPRSLFKVGPQTSFPFLPFLLQSEMEEEIVCNHWRDLAGDSFSIH